MYSFFSLFFYVLRAHLGPYSQQLIAFILFYYIFASSSSFFTPNNIRSLTILPIHRCLGRHFVTDVHLVVNLIFWSSQLSVLLLRTQTIFATQYSSYISWVCTSFILSFVVYFWSINLPENLTIIVIKNNIPM